MVVQTLATASDVAAPIVNDGASDIRTLPRSQVGTTPQHMLMTLLGDYWNQRTEHLPSAALVDLLAEFEVSAPSARAALNRLAKRGLLVSSKRGRNTYYGVEPRAMPLLQSTFERYVAFGNRESRPWDGAWTLVAFSIPESKRQLRYTVRSRLSLLGFAALYDGLWCSPWDDRDAVLDVLSELDVAATTVMRAEVDARSVIQPLAAWDLDAVMQTYIDFEAEFAPLLIAARDGRLTASGALVARTKVMDSWRNFIVVDPELPAELLPEGWPRSRMRKLCFELHDTLAPIAQGRCQQIIAQYAPELAALVARQTPASVIS